MKKKCRDVSVVGFALFAMFLGAGNLIFPPTLGRIAGDAWSPTMLGFMATGIGLPILGIISTSKAGGRMQDIAKPLGRNSSTILGFLIMLAIGPLLAIPRTAAVTYEIGIKPLFPNFSPVLASAIFFGITIHFALNSSEVVDKVGTYLTPMLLVTLLIIIGTGIFFPMGTPISTGATKNFLRGFEEGYQTMDALGSVVLASIVIQNINKRGYPKGKEQIRLTVMAGIIAGLGLAVVYGGLVYIGATGSGLFSTDLSRVELLMELIAQLFGTYGKAALGIAVSLACLTTSIGLTATAGDYFSSFSESISHRHVVYATCGFSAFFSIYGVDNIINFAVPILSVLYPVTIALIVMTLFDRFIPQKSAYKGATLGALLVSVTQTLAHSSEQINSLLARLQGNSYLSWMTPQSVNFETPVKVIESLPLAQQGLAWVFPAIIMALIFALVEYLLKKKKPSGS